MRHAPAFLLLNKQRIDNTTATRNNMRKERKNQQYQFRRLLCKFSLFLSKKVAIDRIETIRKSLLLLGITISTQEKPFNMQPTQFVELIKLSTISKSFMFSIRQS